MSALNRKLLRDLVAMKGQAFAIAMVVGAGVSMYVMYLSNFASLQGTRAAYYSQQRFADVFVAVKRAPERIAGEIAALPGVSAIETRVVANVTLDLEQLDEPATGRLVSIPADRRPRVNDLFLSTQRPRRAGHRGIERGADGDPASARHTRRRRTRRRALTSRSARLNPLAEERIITTA